MLENYQAVKIIKSD